MKYLKIFIILTLSIFSLKSEAQKKFSLSSLKLGYSPITNNKLFNDGEVNHERFYGDINYNFLSEKMFVVGLLSDVNLSSDLTLRLGLSYSNYDAEFIYNYYYSYYTPNNEPAVEYVNSRTSTEFNALWLDAYLEKKIRSKVFRNFYYGVSVGYLEKGYNTDIWENYLVLYNEPYSEYRLGLNLTAGTEIRIFRNTNAFVELGYFQKGLLTVGISQDFFNRETGKSVN